MIATKASGINRGKFDSLSGRALNIVHGASYLGKRVHTEYSDEFYTPASIVKPLGPFDLDPCAGPISNHARRNIRPPQDGLAIPWKGRLWLNPPYSNLYLWLERFQSHGDGICLVNARCDTQWFQRLAKDADAVFFLAGRIKFLTQGGQKLGKNPPIGSVLVAYGQHNAESLAASGLAGLLLYPRPSNS